MAVREFNGSTDALECAIGACSGMTHGTAAMIVKVSSVSIDRAFAHLHNSGGTWLASSLQANPSSELQIHNGTLSAVSPFTISTNVWYMALMRKATGTAAPRFSLFNYNTTGWTHGNSATSAGNWTAPGAGGFIRFRFETSGDEFAGRIAARGLWSNTLPWSADASGDSALESAGLEDAATNWLSNNPSVFHLFNQASTATPVEDLSTTGTADETSINGTTVVTGDDPPNFDFSLGGGPVSEFMPRVIIVAG